MMETEEKLVDEIAGTFADPAAFVLMAFDWGYGELDDMYPDEWQLSLLRRVGEAVLSGNAGKAIQEAIASGHGIGKSAMTAWIILWAMSTRPNLSGVVTANTKNQLDTKTWRELALWHKRAINAHWFEWTATKFYQIDNPETWAVNSIPQTEHNSEAFAGLHAEHVLVIFDEASAIPDKIWEVTEGAMTTDGAMWFVFGNPTKNTGRFRDCFGKLRHRWSCHKVDSRTAKMTNKSQIQTWLEDYGEDSDFFRIRVRGEFPMSSSDQFISISSVERAKSSDPEVSIDDPLIIGVDVARFGDDDSVIWFRRGLDAKTIEPIVLNGVDTMQLASKVSALAKGSYHTSGIKADMVFVDEGGVGGGVVDRLRMLGVNVIGVNFGGKADSGISLTRASGEKYFNKRSEIWGIMRAALESGLSIPVDNDLEEDLISPEYSFNEKNEIVLERKKDIKKRIGRSPDRADALAITFSYPVTKVMDSFSQDSHEYNPYHDASHSSSGDASSDYNPYE
ncbi:MAG: terminase [Thiomicrospira sp.]|nr:MAG: terminase [Thiomicrospira sp.]